MRSFGAFQNSEKMSSRVNGVQTPSASFRSASIRYMNAVVPANAAGNDTV